MSIKKFLFPLLLACSALALIYRLFTRAFAMRASAKPITNSASFDAIDAYVEQEMHRLNIPGVSLAIVEGDKIVHLSGFGRARPGGEAPTPEMPFFIGSLTKPFTALAVMQLVEAGKVELDAPGPALPALVPGGGPCGLRPDDRAAPAQPDQRPADAARVGEPWRFR